MNQGIGGRGRGLSRATIALGVVVVLVLALSAFGWWALSRSPGSPFSGFEHSADSLGVLIRSWGAWGVAGSIGLMVLHSFVPFPAEILAIANGMVYGPFWGTVVTWVGAMLGAFLAFGLARRLGRPFVRAVVPAPRWQAVDSWSRRHGGGTLLIKPARPPHRLQPHQLRGRAHGHRLGDLRLGDRAGNPSPDRAHGVHRRDHDQPAVVVVAGPRRAGAGGVARLAPLVADRRFLEGFPLKWNRTGPHPRPAAHEMVSLGRPGGGAGWSRLNG